MSDGVFPYPDRERGHSSGWSGSDTSRDRAHERDASGKTAKLQARVLALLAERGASGITVAEAREAVAEHHGSVSGTLSNLHRAGKILRLSEKRGRAKVYVLPEHQDGRVTEQQGRTVNTTNAAKIAKMERLIEWAESRNATYVALKWIKEAIE